MRRAPLVGLVGLSLLALPSAAAGQDDRSATPVVGGGSFNTAPLLKPGTYSDTVVTSGETTYYRVALKKGQRLRIAATFDATGVETNPSRPGYVAGINQVAYDAKLYTPLRQELVLVDEETTGDQELQTKHVSSKLALGYEELLSDFTDDDFNGPGTYYVGLSTNDLLGNNVSSPVEIPTTLRIRVTGTAQPSSRFYRPRLIGDGGSGSSSRPAGGQGPPGLALASAGEGAGEGVSLGAIVALGAFALLGGAAIGALGAAIRRERTP